MARCPQNTGGKGSGRGGGKRGYSMSFCGLAFPEGHRADGEGIGGHRADDDDRPPWDDNEDEQDIVANEVFTSFQRDGRDPFQDDDPWERRGRSRTNTSSSWYQPARARSASPRRAADPFGLRPHEEPRVDDQDELSDTEPQRPEPEPTIPAPPTPAPTTATFVQPSGYTTPPAPYQWEPVGIFNSWQNRTNGTPISDSMLQRVYQCAQFSGAVRPRQPAHNLHLMRHQWPLSVAPSSSARQTNQMFSPPVAQPYTSTLDRFRQAVQLVTQTREQQREQRRSYYERPTADATMGADIADGQLPPPPAIRGIPIFTADAPRPWWQAPLPVPSAPPAVEATATDAAAEETVPVIQQHLFEETDRCSLCQSDFQHGEHVCRISCYHVFHTECWNRMFRHADGERRSAVHCPNCRAPGVDLIAMWPWISRSSPITQNVEGIIPSNGYIPPHSPRPTPSGSADAQALASPSQPPGSPSPILYTETYGDNDQGSAYHIQTQLPDGRPAILVDPGSVGNLCGSRWAEKVALTAKRAGLKPKFQRRETPLTVSGVGNGSQSCRYDCALPVSLRLADQPDKASTGTLTIPSISNSDLPGLLGLQSLRKNRAVLDFNTLCLYFCGPGDSEMEKSLPPGTDKFQLELAPSGHLVLPCCEYGGSSSTTASDYSLTLVTKTSLNGNENNETEETSDDRGGLHADATTTRRIPPAPTEPPRIPSRVPLVVPPPARDA